MTKAIISRQVCFVPILAGQAWPHTALSSNDFVAIEHIMQRERAGNAACVVSDHPAREVHKPKSGQSFGFEPGDTHMGTTELSVSPRVAPSPEDLTRTLRGRCLEEEVWDVDDTTRSVFADRPQWQCLSEDDSCDDQAEAVIAPTSC